jgi:hypothetical protein
MYWADDLHVVEFLMLYGSSLDVIKLTRSAVSMLPHAHPLQRLLAEVVTATRTLRQYQQLAGFHLASQRNVDETRLELT